MTLTKIEEICARYIGGRDVDWKELAEILHAAWERELDDLKEIAARWMAEGVTQKDRADAAEARWLKLADDLGLESGLKPVDWLIKNHVGALKARVKELEQNGLEPGQIHAHGTFVRTCWVCQEARLAPLLALALRHEWVHMGHLGERCPSCYAVRKSGHIPKCDWSAALAATEEGKE